MSDIKGCKKEEDEDSTFFLGTPQNRGHISNTKFSVELCSKF